MTDFEKLMQNSETMRMLKIGNPERSEDFGISELQSGLFELERQTRENLENLIYTSPDPNGSIIKHDTALMLNNLGLDMETSRKLAEGGFASTATGIDTRSKSYGDALVTKAQHTYWNEMRGVNASLYRISGNPEFLQNAQEYDKKVFQNPVFDSYGWLGDLVLDSVQPAISSAKFLLTNAILSWIPGGVTNAIWGPAIAKLVAKGGGIAATGVNFLSTGYSQAGNVLYDVMQMTDAEGNTLPWDSPLGGILFHSLAGLMGLVELGSMEMFPWYKQLKSRFTSREVADYLKKGIAKSLLDVTFKGIVGTGGESVEEGFQSGLEDGFTNALKAIANKDGADFALISLGDSVEKGTKAFWEAGRSMFLTSFLSAGVGQGVYASKVRIEAAKNFKKSENSQSVDASFLGVSRSAVADAKAEEAKKGEQAKDAPADTEETKLDPIKVVNLGPRLSPVNDEELRKAAKAVNLGANAVEVEVVEMPEIQAEDQFSLINRAALASGAKIIDGEELGFEDEQSMIKGMYLIAPSVEAVDDGSDVKVVTIRNENGELSKISMRVIPEDMSEEHITDPDIMFSEDPEAPYALSMMSEERALEWEERNLIRNALGDVATHTKGRFSSADIEASIDAVKTVAETLNMPTDKLLSEGVVFHLTDKVQDEWGNEALGSIASNITVDGKKQYTINLSKKANVSTVLHELGHLLRGFATKEQLAEFRKYYGGGEEAAFLEDINLADGKYQVGSQAFDTLEDARDYVIGNEERFADDFVAYMMTGEAPTAGLKNIFRRMKAVLHRFIAQYGNRLTPEVKEAFDNLIAGKQLVTQGANNNQGKSATGNVGTFDGENPNILFQPAPPTDSEAFRAWFGDSKVVDENGNPLVVYHGTIYSFNDFRIGDIGFHFGDIEQAEARVEGETNPNIMGVYLSIENPYISSYDYGSWDGDYVARGFIERGEFTDDADVAILKNIAKLPAPRSSTALRKFLRDKGYDGVVYPNAFEGEGDNDSYIAFSPTQIKSATGNIGTFDGENPNILFQKDLSRAEYAEVYDRYYNTDQWMKAPNGEWSNLNEQQWVAVRTPEFLEWFGNWIDDPKSVELALDENGEPEVFYHGSYTDDIEIFKIQPRLGYYNSDRNRGGFSFTNNKEKAEAYAVPQQKRVKAISNYLRELERALEDEGIVDLDSLEDPDNASPRLKRFYELLEEDEDTTGYTFEGRLPTFEYVYWDGYDFPFREGRELWSKHVPRVIEKEFPELAKRLRKAGRDLRVGKGMTTPKVYEVFLRIPEGTNTKSLTPKTLYEIGDFFDVSKEKTGAFVVLMPEGEKVAYIADSKMIKSATDNAGTFDGENPNILYQKTDEQRQYDAVMSEYRSTEQWMKAPNGKATNLTERQWVLVRTPSFLEWFGDWMNDPENASKVVDENGEPKVLYHGSSTEIGEIRGGSTRGDLGTIYLTDNISVADGYALIGSNRHKGEIMRGDESIEIAEWHSDVTLDGRFPNVLPVFLNAKNITNVENVGDIIEVLGFEKIYEALENDEDLYHFTGIEYDEMSIDKINAETLKDYIKQTYSDDYVRENIPYDGFSLANASEEFRVLVISGELLDEYMEKKQSDAILIPDDPENSGNTYIPRNATQIKSATGNIGTFDASNPNILFQPAPPTDSEAFKDWFGDSKVVDENGQPLVVYHGTDAEFDSFAPKDGKNRVSNKQLDFGSHFTVNREYARAYSRKGNVIPVYLNISNPLDLVDANFAYKGDPLFDALFGLYNDLGQKPLPDMYRDRDGNKHDDVQAVFMNAHILNALPPARALAAIKDAGFDGVKYQPYQRQGLDRYTKDPVSYIAFSPTQIKSVNNQGTWDAGNPNILYQKTMDDRYFEALDRGDEETARKIVDDMARKRGYLSGNDFRMNHKAPNGRNDYDVNLPNLNESELLPKDFWDHPRWYADDRELYSFWKVKEAIDRYRRNGKANLRLYRAVPKDVREDWFRNGDWVTPDRTYAQDEGALIPGGYRIIFHSVPIEHVWWDVNSIAELGYDDGGEYVYRNTKNNRKLFDTVVRDADGNIVPPSKRFNFRSDTLYQKAPKEGTKEFEQTFASTKIVDENGNPKMVYHGSMREWQGADAEFDPHEIGSQSDPGDAGEGFYFATTPLGAYAYTNGKQDNVHGYYLDIRNPFVIGEQYDRESRQAWEAVKQDKDPGVLPTVQMIADMVRGAGYDPGELTKFRGYTSVYDVVRRVGSGNFSNLLKANGYDGVVYGDEIVAFDPGQIYYASKPATLYQIEAYHGTSKDFDKFSTDFIGSGFSGGAYGWGLYFTTSEDTARNYAEIIGNRNLEKRALYKINLGRIGKHTLLPWSEPINERVRSMLREPMLKLEYPRSLHLQYGTSTTEGLVSVALGENATGNSLYFILEKAFDDWSGEKASLFLREHGITGTVKSDLMGNYTYAIFDENAVEIVGKTLYKMAPPLGTEDFKEWYGSSVLVDGKGNPIELLHGSQSMFNDFARTQKNDNGYLGAGHYFTGIRGVALAYATKNNDGHIYHAYLKMENPLRYDQEWDKKWTEIRNEVVAENPEVPENSNLFGKLLAEKLQDNGYDGVLDMRNGTVAEAVVFSNDQIGVVTVESYNLGEAGSEYNRRKIGEMRQRQIAKNAVQQAIPDLTLAQGNLVPPTLYQVQNLPKWKEDTRAWMKANGYTGAQIDRHIAGIEGQLKIFDFVGPYEIDLLPHGAGLNPWKRVSQKGDVTYQGGPIRTNDDPIYRISFDLSAMCPKRLSAAATANYVQKKIGRPLSDSERMALTALYRAHGKEAPCIYCYVESPRSKASSFVLKALEVVLGGEAPKTWSSETLALAEEARAEAVAKNVQRGDLNAHMLMDPELASSDEFEAEVDKYPTIYKFLKKQMLNAKANLPKLYEEYEGQILNLPDDFIDMLNGYAGIRFFSSSDFQAQHVVDLIQAVYDMNVRGAKAHAYTKVPKFVEVFGGTGIKINTSIFAKEENGQIVEDNWQGMGWEDAKRFRQQYPDVGTILVASSDNIVKWALEQDWIDYIIPFHYSSLEKKYYSTMKWEDFTSTQVEKPINVGEEVQKIRQYETGSVDGVSVEQGTKNYLELAMKRRIIPVFPTFLFNDGMDEVLGKNGKPYKNQRKAKTDRAVARWREMVESGEIDWSQINHNYYKLRKDYARTDTPFHVVQPNINFEQASDVLKEYLSGAEDGVRGEREIGDELVRMIIDSEGTDIDLGVEVLRGVQEGRMSGKDPLFQRMSPPGSQEFMSWYKGSVLVDGDGAPLKLYHGTASIFTEYNSEYGTLNMGDSEGSKGFFFTTDKDEAISYAEFAVSPEVMAYRDEHRAVLRKMVELGVKRGSDHPLEERALELERKITEAEALIEIGAQAWDPVVSGVYVRITNPAIIDLSDPDITGEIDFQQLIQEAKASGHDGFIYKDVNESEEIHVVAFSDSQVGAVEYSLSSEGFETEHEFPAARDSILESAIEYKGHKIIPHDLGMDYSEKNLDGIIEKVDQELKQITLYQSKLEWEPYPLEISTGKRLTQKEKGFKDRAYTNMWGWDGSEDHPTIDEDWTKFRKLDLEGAILRDVSDIAKLFSIYRNPYIEFFHIIYTREMADGTIKIKGHHAMTSGAPAFTMATSRRFPDDIAEGMKKYRATGYYLMHNHPSGHVNPSWQDHEITVRYIRSAPGFKGHIILDHNEFYLYEMPYKELRERTVEVPGGGFHGIPRRAPLNENSFSTPQELGEYGIKVMGSRDMLVIYLDNMHRAVHVQPVETLNIDEVYENVEKYLYSKAVLVTSSKKRYQEALDADRYVRAFKGEAFLDIVLHHTLKKDGSVTITSARATGQLEQSGYDFWHTKYLEEKGTLLEEDNYVFEKGKTLYQLSDEARKAVVESRKQDVKAAVEQYYWIPDDVLQEYAGEDWADREIRFRTRLKENPWVLEEARGYTDPDEYLEFVTSRDRQDGKEPSAEARKWWRRAYEYARVESAAERNLRFVREHASTDKDLIALGKRLRGYITTDQKTGKRGYRLGAFKGVSPLVKTLSPNSSSEDIQKARTLVTENPEPYRKALQKIVQAERVVDNDGKFDLPSQEDREAYYDSLGEEMSDALKEPLLINKLGGEDAEFHRESYTEREKMATLNGVLEIEDQADKELAALRSEYDRKSNSLTELQKRFDIVTREVNKLGDELREVRKDRNKLKRNLKGTQETAVNLREALAEKREAYRKLERERKALERKLHAVRTRRDLEKYHKAILASAKFNPDSVDASYEEALNTIHDLFRQDYKEGGYEILPEMLTRYLDDEGLHAIKANKRIGDWSLQDLGTLYYAIRAMKADARVMLERKKVARSGKLQNLAIKYYSQLYGELPEIDPLEGGVMGSIMEELSIKQKKYQEGMFGAIWNTVAGAMIHSQRLARIIDGNREGVMYDLLVRRAYENSSNELSHSFERLEAAEAKMRELGVTDKSLRQDLYTYTTIAGDKITLTRGEVIGLYVYSQNELSMEKLIMSWGNGIQPLQLAEAVAKLTDAEKAWGDYMIDSLGGDDPWERMRDVYYNVYNKNLGRRKRYFTFVADGNLNEGNTDLLNGPKGRPIRYTDKGMTKEVVPHARYALKLDVTRTFTQQVKRQEHFIAWAEWVRDLNYLLSSRGSIGAMIEANHGAKFLTQVQDFVNDIGSPQVILDDIERLGNKILSNAVVGALSFNALTPLKQLASLSAVVRGDIDISSLFHAVRRLGNPAIQDKVVKMIHEKSPKMKNRSFDVEVAKYSATEFDTELGMVIKAINEKVGMKAIQWMDQFVANLVWLSAYDTALKKGATDAEAAFRATEVVGETQSSTNISDLSSLQRNKSPWVRSMLMFTNDIVQHLNQIWFDMPYYVRSKQYRKAFGTIASIAIAGAISMLVSGQLFRGDDDDEEYLKKIAKAILGIIVSDTIPIVGNAVESGVSGWGGGDMVDLPSAFGRFLGATTDLEGEKLLNAFLNLIEAGLKFGALPVTAGNRVVRAVREQNPLHLLNYDYAELWEEWL